MGLAEQRQSILILVVFSVGGWVINVLGSLLPYWWDVRPEIVNKIFPGLGYIIIAIGVVIVAIKFLEALHRSSRSFEFGSLQVEFSEALQRAHEEPDKVKPAWDVARVKLESYFDRNLSQINYIFWLSVVVMLVGFCFILFGISGFTTNPQGDKTISATSPAAIAGAAGIITEFIGATFLFIYRSTIEQASNYTRTLERINSVGMAMQILDTISPDATGLQDQTKAEIVKLLLAQSEAVARIAAKRAPTGKSKKESTAHEEAES
jgi:nitrate reductase gamma subunit